MERLVVLLLILGFVTASPVSKQKISANNNNYDLQTEDSESEIKYDTNFNKGETEQKKQELTTNIGPSINGEMEQNLEVIIEETVDVPRELLSPISEAEDTVLDDNTVSVPDDVYPNEIIERHPEEIMETAAGFIPVPIIKRRQKPKRRIASRRHFKRNPYRRVFYYYPYYPYYYQSSLYY
ncbi:unnamed protein product [Diatraea saccharalis]|uniref:Uncharacterized protein n=1 Tax=Diatraea saccharalis TaxID=40085 RepID=A0A9N9QZU4_9NEOP|nr:unnamed protein product [Diatraea saccharalis]